MTDQKVVKKNEVTEPAMSERFTDMVIKEFGSNFTGQIRVTDYQRQLIQGYFIGIDRTLKKSEKDRLRKNENNKDHKYDNKLEFIWKNVNLPELATDIINYAKIGLDMLQDNHLNPIPFKNHKEQKYDIGLIKGYNGIQYIAEKYAIEKPLSVHCELVYSTDTFSPLKKNKDNNVESYDFKINNAFARGELIGGFGYIEYVDPSKNKLIVMTIKDILKRKPSYAAAQFWGGTSKKWEGGKYVETKVEGWYEEMCLKTIKREVYSAKNIARDPKKIDDNYQHMKMKEVRQAEALAQAEVDLKANGEVIDTTATETEKPAIQEPAPAAKSEEQPAAKTEEKPEDTTKKTGASF